MLANPTGYGPFGHNTVGKLINSLAHVGVWQGATVAVALGTVAVLTVFPVDQTRRDLGMLAALVIVAVVVSVFHISAESVGHLASIPSSFPAAVAPDWSAIPRLLLGGFAISLVALAQAAGISARSPTPMAASLPRAGPGPGQPRHRVLPGAARRRVPVAHRGVAVSAGARTRWAGIFAGLWLIGIVILFGHAAQ